MGRADRFGKNDIDKFCTIPLCKFRPAKCRDQNHFWDAAEIREILETEYHTRLMRDYIFEEHDYLLIARKYLELAGY